MYGCRHQLSKTIISTLFAAILLSSSDAQAGQCLMDTREVKVDKTNAVQLSEYLCRRDKEAAPSFRVQFQRVNEMTAGVLLNSGRVLLVRPALWQTQNFS